MFFEEETRWGKNKVHAKFGASAMLRLGRKTDNATHLLSTHSWSPVLYNKEIEINKSKNLTITKKKISKKCMTSYHVQKKIICSPISKQKLNENKNEYKFI